MQELQKVLHNVYVCEFPMSFIMNCLFFKESLSFQLPFYEEVVAEKEKENERVWNEKLHAIQRKIAARKIQIHFRQYLNCIKTRDSKKNKKGSKKKLVQK